MSRRSDDSGCGLWIFVVLVIGGIIAGIIWLFRQWIFWVVLGVVAAIVLTIVLVRKYLKSDRYREKVEQKNEKLAFLGRPEPVAREIALPKYRRNDCEDEGWRLAKRFYDFVVAYNEWLKAKYHYEWLIECRVAQKSVGYKKKDMLCDSTIQAAYDEMCAKEHAVDKYKEKASYVNQWNDEWEEFQKLTNSYKAIKKAIKWALVSQEYSSGDNLIGVFLKDLPHYKISHNRYLCFSKLYFFEATYFSAINGYVFHVYPYCELELKKKQVRKMVAGESKAFKRIVLCVKNHHEYVELDFVADGDAKETYNAINKLVEQTEEYSIKSFISVLIKYNSLNFGAKEEVYKTINQAVEIEIEKRRLDEKIEIEKRRLDEEIEKQLAEATIRMRIAEEERQRKAQEAREQEIKKLVEAAKKAQRAKEKEEKLRREREEQERLKRLQERIEREQKAKIERERKERERKEREAQLISEHRAIVDKALQQEYDSQEDKPLYMLLDIKRPERECLKSIREVYFAQRFEKALDEHKCRNMFDILSLSINDLMNWSNVGKTTITDAIRSIERVYKGTATFEFPAHERKPRVKTVVVERESFGLSEEEKQLIIEMRKNKEKQKREEEQRQKKLAFETQYGAITEQAIRQISGPKTITNNIFSCTYVVEKELSGEEIKLFFVASDGETVSKVASVSAVSPGETFKVQFELLSNKIETQSNCYLLVKSTKDDSTIAKLEYKLNITFVSDFDI